MLIAIVGAGAIGCLFGSALHDSGHDVLLIHHDRRVVAKIRRDGLSVRRLSGKMVQYRIAIKEAISEEDDPDLAIVTVKAYDTEEVTRLQLKSINHIPIITMQNGLGNVEALQRSLQSRFVLAGSTTEGAMTAARGLVYHTGTGMTRIGELTGKVTARCLAIQKAFVESGFRTLVSTNILAVLWLKAIVNSAINPVSALAGASNRKLLETADLWHLCIRVVKEGIQVAESRGILLPENPVSMLRTVLESTGDNKSSMLRDVETGHRTEIRELNGMLMAIGRRLRVKTPYNQLLSSLVLGIESMHQAEQAQR